MKKENSDIERLMRAHSRDSVGLKYVYPVISRRAGGVSIGVNLNVNCACNWQCAYCQVPGLTRGKPDPVDVDRLDSELRAFLDDIIYGDFMRQYVPESVRVLKDIAFSGNGEPTAASEFPEVVARLKIIKQDYPQLAEVPVRVITNGSLMRKPAVLSAISELAELQGEIWFKVDTVDESDQQRINGIHYPIEHVLARLGACAERCPTWIQTCLFNWNGAPPAVDEMNRYITFCERAKSLGIRGVYLYTIARETMQRDADHVSVISADAMECFAEALRAVGLSVSVSV